MTTNAISAKQARAIFILAGKPGRSTVETQLLLVSKKIRIASTLKMRKIRYNVIAHYESPHYDGDLAMEVAREMKKLGFTVRIRDTELSITW